MSRRLAGLAAVLMAVVACSPSDSGATTEASTTTTATLPLPTSGPPRPDMEITSTAFEEGAVIPVKYTCDGEDISPRLDVSFPPSGATTLVLIVDDPDAPVGTWDHWVEFDIPVIADEMTWDEGVAILGTPGSNSWNVKGYGGPCPPEGQDHRYLFTVYALDGELLLPEGVSSDAVREAMDGLVLGEAQLMGTYAR